MKKILILLSIISLFTLASCFQKEEEKTEAVVENTVSETSSWELSTATWEIVDSWAILEEVPASEVIWDNQNITASWSEETDKIEEELMKELEELLKMAEEEETTNEAESLQQ